MLENSFQNSSKKFFSIEKNKSKKILSSKRIRECCLSELNENNLEKCCKKKVSHFNDEEISMKSSQDFYSDTSSTSNSSEEEEENLPPPEPPFLPPKKPNDKREYCLVLDLDETLVHFFENEDEAYVKVRMGTETFIKTLSKYCEIVIFTASTRFYADIVINGMDCKDNVDYRLYRQHTTIIDGVNVKDLSKLGRDLSKIIIIDNIEDNYQFQPENGLNISDFEGDENDNELQFLLNDLLHIVMKSGKNVCEELGNVRRNMEKRYTNIS